MPTTSDNAESVLGVADIQGNILRPYGFRHGGFLFLAIHDAEAGRRWLGEIDVTSAATWTDGNHLDHATNVAVSHAGLAALGVPGDILASFPDAFREGMRRRAAQLGDIGPSDPDHWDQGLRGEAHVVVAVHGRRPDLAREQLNQLRGRVDGSAGAVEIVNDLPCDNLARQREHFGFADGLGQPAIDGSGHAHLDGQGVPERRNRWRPLKAGEFVLGYIDEDGVLPETPAEPFAGNGSYMVVRKLEQNVPLFRQYVAHTAGALGLDRSLVAAKLVGRWADGTPLVRSPDHPDAAISSQETQLNAFRYADDPDGFRCPLGAHIRRANPRDALGFEGQLTKRHRMIRRGMPYGDPLADGAADAGPRGLVFVCFVASIDRQFEFVQTQWCNDGDAFGLGEDRDFLVGRPGAADEAANKATLQGRSPAFLVQPNDPFVVTKGGDYFFAPGIRGLRALARAQW